ncbi:MAG TPA: hypothetical protein VK788_22960 [Terriglobales bacterium]|nr:hypothetical protein [Terriglobales bacterium]
MRLVLAAVVLLLFAPGVALLSVDDEEDLDEEWVVDDGPLVVPEEDCAEGVAEDVPED